MTKVFVLIVDMETIALDTKVMAKTKQSAGEVSDLKKHAGFWMRLVSNHVSQSFAGRLLESGVTVAEWVVLRAMYGREAMAPSDLAEEIGMTRGAISKLVDRLVEKGLIARKDRTDDRRFQEIVLTANGHKLVPVLAGIADNNDEQFFSPLTARERELLVATLKKLAEAHEFRKLPTE